MNNLEKSSYFYNLPQELIAQTPLTDRTSSRMLVYDRNKDIALHKHFYDIVDFLQKGDVLVINSSKVLPARLYGEKVETGAKIEILLQKRLSLDVWKVVAKPTKRLKEGTIVKFTQKLSCRVLKILDYGECNVEFLYDGVFETLLAEIGEMPLPHYIHEKLKDKDRYQTVYSDCLGSSAAPTAGLHFTDELLEKLKQKGVIIAKVLLHVGLGTFRPVSADNILDHKMHSEYYEITKETANIINLAKEQKRRVICVGTTSVRVVESASDKDGKLKEKSGDTCIFIYPGYKFKVLDALITNFHLPESTLIMLVSAFVGREKTLELYNKAVEEKYRFFSFGDSMFLC